MKHAPLSLPLAPGATLGLATHTPSIAVPSAFQRIAVEHSVRFGRLYHLDGDAMAAEADEFMLHESLAHLAALDHPAPRQALILEPVLNHAIALRFAGYGRTQTLPD